VITLTISSLLPTAQRVPEMSIGLDPDYNDFHEIWIGSSVWIVSKFLIRTGFGRN